MACGMEMLEWLQANGCLPGGSAVLDIGESCIYYATEDSIRRFLSLFECPLAGAELDRLVEWMVKKSNTFGDTDFRTLFMAELFARTNLRYSGIDVASTGFAERFDLNIHTLAPSQRNLFDLVINFGTTEHLIHQMNAHCVIHDACKPGGHIFHQVPASGYLHHGYFLYDVQFFEDLAKANQYRFKEIWFCGPEREPMNLMMHAEQHPSVADATKPFNGVERFRAQGILSCTINVLFQKIIDAPFGVGLELSTAATRQTGNFTSQFIHPASLPRTGPVLPPIRDFRRR